MTSPRVQPPLAAHLGTLSIPISQSDDRPGSAGRGPTYHWRIEGLAAHGAAELGVTEGEDTSVFGEQPLAPTVVGRTDTGDGCIQGLAAHGAEESSIAEGEGAAGDPSSHGAGHHQGETLTLMSSL
jgi:hypothetical protein